jgi:hypothetical protein
MCVTNYEESKVSGITHFKELLKICQQIKTVLIKMKDSELLIFWTLSIVQYSKKLENNVSETGSVSVLRSGGGGGNP